MASSDLVELVSVETSRRLSEKRLDEVGRSLEEA